MPDRLQCQERHRKLQVMIIVQNIFSISSVYYKIKTIQKKINKTTNTRRKTVSNIWSNMSERFPHSQPPFCCQVVTNLNKHHLKYVNFDVWFLIIHLIVKNKIAIAKLHFLKKKKKNAYISSDAEYFYFFIVFQPQNNLQKIFKVHYISLFWSIRGSDFQCTSYIHGRKGKYLWVLIMHSK